ncbi:DNA alkylation repair enzyme superfamily protein [Ketogulonicigenium robustum]|uniref:DNA alkylation repair enzyme superfamily protein n=1 Tax=Ketogulonicigenium robustum TaxID=92947 RepID=A0A1W6P149_9RHOB|nr:DNA alkylation repair protein [Ketogulonicigenium robustum]ARO15236.1 DNA alkylation repair enzyme superfamily protein [Ketogulonicigenium robustum]
MSLPPDLQSRLVTLEAELRAEGWDPTPAEMIDWLAREMRPAASVEDRLAQARDLWAFGTASAQILAGKLLTQARIADDDAIWETLCAWLETLEDDDWPLIETVCRALERRLEAVPARFDAILPWVTAPKASLRAGFILVNRPKLRVKVPKAADLVRRDVFLDAAAPLTADRSQIVQRALAGALRDLAKHDAARATAFLLAHGNAMVPWARAEAIGRLQIETDARGRIVTA